MKFGAIISRAESLRILKNDLRKAAREKHAAELARVAGKNRQAMMAQIEREIEAELRRRSRRVEPDSLLH